MMIGRLLAAVAITYVLGLVSGFRGAPRFGRSMINGASRLAKEAAVGVLNVKPDLFSGEWHVCLSCTCCLGDVSRG